jgi:hypothetical protein
MQGKLLFFLWTGNNSESGQRKIDETPAAGQPPLIRYPGKNTVGIRDCAEASWEESTGRLQRIAQAILPIATSPLATDLPAETKQLAR